MFQGLPPGRVYAAGGCWALALPPSCFDHHSASRRSKFSWSWATYIERSLALLEPLLAHLELGLELRLAQVETGLALLELLRPAGEDLLALVEGLLLALVPAAGRQDRLLGLVQ